MNKRTIFLYNFLIIILSFSIQANHFIYRDQIKYIYNIDSCKEIKKNEIIILIIFTSNIYEQVMNFYITSIKKFNIINTLFLSLDMKGYYMLKNTISNVYMSFYNQNVSQHIDYNTPLYWKVVYSKTDYVKMLIERKYNVLLCDTDVIFFKDPRKYMVKYDSDLVTTCDHKCPTMNSGL